LIEFVIGFHDHALIARNMLYFKTSWVRISNSDLT
jgi:hypothetical protein